jgi:hypothetical protein
MGENFHSIPVGLPQPLTNMASFMTPPQEKL